LASVGCPPVGGPDFQQVPAKGHAPNRFYF
jgi:hypothetical protein